MVVVAVAAQPDPVALAAAVRPLGDVAVLWSAAGGGPSFVAAGAVERSDALLPAPGPSGPADPLAVPRWVGLLPYEAMRSLERPAWTSTDHRAPPHHVRPAWRRYGAVLRIDHAAGTVHAIGDDAAAVNELARRAARPVTPGPVEVDGFEPQHAERHRARIVRALELIAQGDVYQVCLARRFDGHVTGDLLTAFARLVGAFPSELAFFCDFNDEAAVLSTSPELFLRAVGRDVSTRPIKGTRPRGRDAAADADHAAALDADPKERAELAMIVDLERSDLGRVAAVGSVRVSRAPHVVTHRTLHHRVAEVTATLAEGKGYDDLLRAALPSGSVTGTPKVRAMEVIAGLEDERRGLYTGAMGAIATDGTVTLAMAIRTLTVRDGVGHYHAGGGIVEASDPDREVDETTLKAIHLRALRG